MKIEWILPEHIRELSLADQVIFLNKLDDFPEQNQNFK